jgi:cytochrome c-type biogenesis protein CcmH
LNTVYLWAAIVAVGAAGALFWILGSNPAAKAVRARRKLLLDRAEGRISGEEFEARQAALDAILIEKSAGGSGWPIIAAIIGAGLVTAALFAWLGSRAAVEPIPSSPAQLPGIAAPSAGGQVPPKPGGDLRDLAKPLAEKLAAKPDDGPGWILLGRTYLELHQFKEAEAAFEKASKLVTADAQMLADWADAHVSANNQTWTPAALDMLKRALALDPKNLKGLTLAASEADSRNDGKQAAAYRQKIAKLTSSGAAKEMEAGISAKQGRPGSSALPVLPAQR